MPETIRRLNFITKEQPLIKPVSPVGEDKMGDVSSKPKQEQGKQNTGTTPGKDPKRPFKEDGIYIKI